MLCKKIYSLAAALFAACCPCIAAVSLQRGEPLAGCTALAAPLLLLLPPWLERLLGQRQKGGLALRCLLFSFLACPLGVGLTLYHRLFWYDSLMHLLSGVFFTELGLLAFAALGGPKRCPATRWLYAAVGLCFWAFVALGWELLEFAASLLLGIDPQNVAATGVTDTMQDCLWALLGTLVYLLWFFSKNGMGGRKF